MWVFWGIGLPLTGGVVFFAFVLVFGEVVPVGVGVGLVLPCVLSYSLLCLLGVAGSRASQLGAGIWGYSLSLSVFMFLEVGEDIRLSINNYLTDCWDNFNKWRFMFVETKPQNNETPKN